MKIQQYPKLNLYFNPLQKYFHKTLNTKHQPIPIPRNPDCGTQTTDLRSFHNSELPKKTNAYPFLSAFLKYPIPILPENDPAQSALAWRIQSHKPFVENQKPKPPTATPNESLPWDKKPDQETSSQFAISMNPNPY